MLGVFGLIAAAGADLPPQMACVPGLTHRWTFNEVQGEVFVNSVNNVKSDMVSGVNFYVPQRVTCDQCIPGDNCGSDGFCVQSNPEGTSAASFNPVGPQMFDPISYSRPNKMTATLWFKSTHEQEQALLSFYWTSYNLKLLLTGDTSSGISSGKLKWDMSWSPIASAKTTDRRYNTGEWHFVAVTMDEVAAEAKIYVYSLTEIQNNMMGTFADKLSLPVDTKISHKTMFLQIAGYSTDYPSNYKQFFGAMDDIRLYDQILSVANLRTIAQLRDFPCDATLLSIGQSAVNMAANTFTTFLIDTRDPAICNPLANGTCSNVEYGVTIESCSGQLSGLNLNVNGQTATVADAEASLQAICAATGPANPLCPYVRNRIVVDAADPFSNNKLNQIIVSSKTQVAFNVFVTVGSQGNFKPLVHSFVAVDGESIVCTNSSISASWRFPTISDGSACTDCKYQAWIVDAIKAQGLTLQTRCQLRKFGKPVGQNCSLNKLMDFKLDYKTPSGKYKVVIYGTNDLDKVDGVVTVLDSCLLEHDSDSVGTSPDWYACPCDTNARCGTSQCVNSRCSGSGTPGSGSANETNATIGSVLMIINGNYTGIFEERSLRLAWQTSFVANVTQALQTNASRVQWDNGRESVQTADYITTPLSILPPGGKATCCAEETLECLACAQGLSKQEFCAQDLSNVLCDLKNLGEQCDPLKDECALYLSCSTKKLCEKDNMVVGRRLEATSGATPADQRSVEQLTTDLQAQVKDTNSELHKMMPALDTYFFTNVNTLGAPPTPGQTGVKSGAEPPSALSGGAIAGIVLAVLCPLFCCLLVAFFIKKMLCFGEKKPSKPKGQPVNPQQSAAPPVAANKPIQVPVATPPPMPAAKQSAGNNQSAGNAQARRPSTPEEPYDESGNATSRPVQAQQQQRRQSDPYAPPPKQQQQQQQPNISFGNDNGHDSGENQSDGQGDMSDYPSDGHEEGEQAVDEQLDPPQYGTLMYDWPGEDETEDLPCSQDDEVQLLKKSQHFYTARRQDGRVGLVPANFMSVADHPKGNW